MAANKTKILNQVQKHITKGHWDKAIKELQKLIAEDPSDVRTLLKLGDVYSKQGDRESASRVYRQVAEAYSEQGFFLKAVAVYKQILKHDPNHLEVTLRLAELYEQLNLSSEALGQYQHASRIHEESGDVKRALQVLQRMVGLDPHNVASRIKLAEGFSREGMTAEAAQEFENAAKILKDQGRVEDYVKVAERLLFHDSSRVDVLKETAKILLSRGEAKRGLAKLQVLYKQNNRDLETLELLARAFADLGQDNKTVFVHRELARLHQEMGRPVEASAHYRRVLELEPEDAEAQRALGQSAPSEVPRAGTASSTDLFTGAEPARGPGGSGPLGADSSFGAVHAPSVPDSWGPSPSTASRPPPPPPPEPPLAPELAPRPTSSGLTNLGADLPDEDLSLTLGSADLVPSPAPPPPPSMVPSLAPRPAPPVQSADLASMDPEEQVQKILTETDVFVRYGLRDKALAHIQKAFDVAPDSVGAHEKAREIHLAAGDTAKAAEAVARIVQIYTGLGDKEAVERWRYELSALSPEHPLATAGPSVTSEDISIDLSEGGEQSLDISMTGVAAVDESEDFDPFAGALVDGAAEEIFEETDAEPGEFAFSFSQDLADGADPHTSDLLPAEPSTPEFNEPPTDSPDPVIEADPPPPPPPPSAPANLVMLEELEQDDGEWSPDFSFDDALSPPQDDASAPPSPGLQAVPDLANHDAFTEEPTHSGIEATNGASEHPDMEDELDEARFFIEAELFDEARETLGAVLSSAPAHPGALALLAQIERATKPASPSEPEADDADGTKTEDIALRVETLVSQVPSAGPSEDAFDQGLMYRELGRLDEAIESFKAAVPIDGRTIPALEMIGHCLVDQDETKAGIECFKLALKRGATGAAATNLKYEVGVAYERIHDLTRAAEWYAACAADDPDHRDVGVRLESVRGPGGPGPTSSRRNKISYL